MGTKLDEISQYRQLKGFSHWVEDALLLALPIMGTLFILDVPTRVGVVFFTEQYCGIFLTMYLAATFLSIPARKQSRKQAVPWYDWGLVLLAIPSGLYITARYPELVMNLGRITFERIFFGGLTMVLILEALRRLVSLSLVIIVLAIILYARFAVHFPAFLGGRPMSSDQLINYLYLDPNSMLWMLMLAARSAALTGVAVSPRA